MKALEIRILLMEDDTDPHIAADALYEISKRIEHSGNTGAVEIDEPRISCKVVEL